MSSRRIKSPFRSLMTSFRFFSRPPSSPLDYPYPPNSTTVYSVDRQRIGYFMASEDGPLSNARQQYRLALSSWQLAFDYGADSQHSEPWWDRSFVKMVSSSSSRPFFFAELFTRLPGCYSFVTSLISAIAPRFLMPLSPLITMSSPDTWSLKPMMKFV
jgi:hypothetical protein